MEYTLRTVILTVVVLITSAGVGAQQLVIQPNLTAITREVRESTVFTCTTRGLPSPEIEPYLKWFDTRDSEIIERSSTRRVFIENDGPQALKLYIASIEQRDAGVYTCQGDLQGNDRQRQPIELKVIKGITFDHVPTPQHPRIYSDALIECRISGQPTPQMSFRYKGRTIVTGGRYLLDQQGLRIRNITTEDNGEYLCVGEVLSQGKIRTEAIIVYVHIPPRVHDVPDATGVEGEEATVTCVADGDPDPKYDFYKDDNQNPVMSADDRIIVDRDLGAIHFRPVHKSDEGRYRCEATNDVGIDNKEGFLTVLVRPKIHELLNVTGLEGESATLVCLSHGHPAPSMAFRKEGNPRYYEEGENEGGRVVMWTTAPGRLEMTINNLRPDDLSNYTCKSTNEAGEDLRNGTITVHYSPRFPVNHPTQFYLWGGKVRNLTCFILAEPEPNINWFRNGERLVNNETYRIYRMVKNTNLQITCREEDLGWIYGTYTCHAENQRGAMGIDLDVMRGNVPHPPRALVVKEESPTMLLLSVEPPENDGGVAIYGYRLEYETVMQDFDLDQDIRLENLRPGKEYIFRVRALNEVGLGSPLEKGHFMKDIRVPFPIVFTSGPDGEYMYEYKLQWERPRTGGLPIVQYEFLYRQVRHLGGQQFEPQGDWTRLLRDDEENRPALYYRLEGLRPGTWYQVKVRARNDIGWSLENDPPMYFHTKFDGAVAGESAGSVGDGESGTSSQHTTPCSSHFLQVFMMYSVVLLWQQS